MILEMLLLVNCQNAFLAKCESKRLRVIVEAAGLLEPARVLAWTEPPPSAIGKEVWENRNEEYELAVYPEISKLNLNTIRLQGLDRLPREFYEDIRQVPEVFICGCNSESWLITLALELWSVSRIRPTFIMEAWFSIGPAGTHGKAIHTLSRHFGAGIFKSWESIRGPLVRKKEREAEQLSEIFLRNARATGL